MEDRPVHRRRRKEKESEGMKLRMRANVTRKREIMQAMENEDT